MDDWTLLIDLGTSFSRVAVATGDRVEPVRIDGATAVPSGVWAGPRGELLTGVAAAERAAVEPAGWERAPLRRIDSVPPVASPVAPPMSERAGGPRPGRVTGLRAGASRAAGSRVGGSRVEPADALAAVMTRLADAARVAAAAMVGAGGRRGGTVPPPARVRLVVPSRWDGARRQGLLTAAARAGLETAGGGAPELVDAAVATGRRLRALGRLPAGSRVALHEVGGGGTSTSVLVATGDGVELLAVGGLDGVGGELFDDLLWRQVVDRAVHAVDPAASRHLLDPPDTDWRRSAVVLLRAVRRAKEQLSDRPAVEWAVEVPGRSPIGVRVDRFELEGVLRPYVLRAARELAATIELAGERPRQLGGLLVAGGAGRMPLVARALNDVTGAPARVPGDDLADAPALLGAAGAAAAPAAGPGRPVTATGRLTGDDAARATADAAAAMAATGSIDLSAVARRAAAPGAGPDPAAEGPTAARQRISRLTGARPAGSRLSGAHSAGPHSAGPHRDVAHPGAAPAAGARTDGPDPGAARAAGAGSVAAGPAGARAAGADLDAAGTQPRGAHAVGAHPAGAHPAGTRAAATRADAGTHAAGAGRADSADDRPRSAWRRRWAVIAAIALVLLIGGLVTATTLTPT